MGTEVLERIAAWERAGLIDAETGARLRAAEVTRVPPDGQGWRPTLAPTRSGTGLESVFGPTPSIAELFAYVGGGFVLAAWHLLSMGTGSGPNVVEWLLPAIALAGGGAALYRGRPREQSAAGVLFAVATAHVLAAVAQLLDALGFAAEPALTFAGAAAVIAALAFRRVHPSLLTQAGLLGATLAFAGSALQWGRVVLYPSTVPEPGAGFPPPPDPAADSRVALQAAWWLVWAFALALLAHREGRTVLDAASASSAAEARAAASRRAALTRFTAGMTAIAGAMSALTTSDWTTSGEWERVIPVWLGEMVILIVAAVLLALAMRRGQTSYLYPAAIGLIAALSDLNATYIAERTGIGMALLVEGVILIGVGVLADRLRRRLTPPATTAGPEVSAGFA